MIGKCMRGQTQWCSYRLFMRMLMLTKYDRHDGTTVVVVHLRHSQVNVAWLCMHFICRL